ncbi:MAG: hypothetical protein ACI4AA_10235 [Lachnospiraceae bacterium]
MKKINVLRLVLSVTLAAFLLCGCGNSKEAPAEEVPEVAVEEEVTEENEVEEEEQQSVEEETSAGEEVAEEPKEEGEEVTYITDYGTLDNYMKDLEVNKPAILIYNEIEGYIIKMEEGQHYTLKKDDKIIINKTSNASAIGYNFNVVETHNNFCACGEELIPIYSEFEQNQEFFYSIWLTDDPDEVPLKLTCYLDAPAE